MSTRLLVATPDIETGVQVAIAAHALGVNVELWEPGQEPPVIPANLGWLVIDTRTPDALSLLNQVTEQRPQVAVLIWGDPEDLEPKRRSALCQHHPAHLPGRSLLHRVRARLTKRVGDLELMGGAVRNSLGASIDSPLAAVMVSCWPLGLSISQLNSKQLAALDSWLGRNSSSVRLLVAGTEAALSAPGWSCVDCGQQDPTTRKLPYGWAEAPQCAPCHRKLLETLEQDALCSRPSCRRPSSFVAFHPRKLWLSGFRRYLCAECAAEINDPDIELRLSTAGIARLFAA